MKDKNNFKFLAISLILLLAIVGVGYKYLMEQYGNKPLITYEDENPITNDRLPNSDDGNNSKPKKATDFTVYDELGNPIKISDYKGVKPVVINFWASWCPPCKFEMPFFQDAFNKYSNDDVEILMVNLTDGMRETKEDAMEYMSKNNYTMKTVFDLEESAAIAYSIQAVPRTIFISKDGDITYDHRGVIVQEQINNNIDMLINQ